MDTKTIVCVRREDCTGCGACKSICPKGAIFFAQDKEGFPIPQIKEEKCINCGLCEKTCPALHPPVKGLILEAYAAQILDKKALQDSTSGGLFTVFSREIFRRGGTVFGCIWDNDYNAVIVRATTEQEMIPMRGSKYVWSNASDSYQKVKEDLEAGKPVLFTGTPCQAAGLRNYLRKDYESLYIMDFFCGGAPSPVALKAYVHSLTKHFPQDKLDLKFRDKDRYGVGVHITYQQKKGKVFQGYLQNPYFYSYHTKVFHRLACYHCQYRTGERFEDLTMGDYWGIGQFHKEFDINAGVSALLVSSDKGRELLDAIKNQLQLVPTEAYNIAVGNNLDIGGLQREFHVQPFRSGFLDLCIQDNWEKAERKYIKYNKSRIMMLMKKHVKTKVPGFFRQAKKIKKMLIKKC